MGQARGRVATSVRRILQIPRRREAQLQTHCGSTELLAAEYFSVVEQVQLARPLRRLRCGTRSASKGRPGARQSSDERAAPATRYRDAERRRACIGRMAGADRAETAVAFGTGANR